MPRPPVARTIDTADAVAPNIAAQAATPIDLATALALLDAGPGATTLCDAGGRVLWCSRVLLDAAGRGDGLDNLTLADALRLSRDDAVRLDDALRSGGGERTLPDMAIGDGKGGTSWWRPHLQRLPGGRCMIGWLPVDEQRRQAESAARLAELLELAQEFGRFGVWQRDTRTLRGLWDRHVLRFWGLGEAGGAPDIEAAAQSILAEDRPAVEKTMRESLKKAGSYSQRCRVRSADGTVRRLHSQWVVRNGADGLPERALGILVDDTEAWTLAQRREVTDEQLALAVDLGQIVVWRNDLSTGRVRFSDKAAGLMGLSSPAQDIDAAQLLELVYPEDRMTMRHAFEQALASLQPVDAEARFRSASGGWRHLLTRQVLQRGAAGEPLAIIGVGLDLGERVQSLRQRTELMRQFELTTRAAGIGYWSLDGATRQVRWSDQTYVLHGLGLDMPAPSMDEWLQHFVPAAERSTVRRRFRAWVRSGRPNLEMQLRIVRGDGTLRHVLSHSRLEGSAGGYDLFGVLTDLTERRAAEAALHAASERAALATRGAGLGTWEQDLRSGEAIWDEQMWRLRGLEPRAQAPGPEARMELVHPDDRETLQREMQRTDHDGSLRNSVFRVCWPDGQVRWIASRSVAARGESGRPVRRIGVNWDITDSRSAQIAQQEKAVAQRESQAKSQFLSRMSHELRTPLNAVLGFAQLLLADGEKVSAETRRRRLEQIHSAGQHLLSLIDDVLDLSRLEGGELRMVATAVPMAALVAETLPLVERLARQRKVKLRSGTIGSIARADSTRLRQVLLNLLTNAVKYNREGGQVLVEAETLDHEVVLRVSDTGRGMSEAQLRHVFEPFNRLGLEREGIEGTGIGLAIVKALVERMDGSVRVHSTPGEGSRFEVLLPEAAAADAETPDAPAAGRPAAAARSLGRPARLLYIEDNPVNLMIVQELVARRPDLLLESAADGLGGVRQALASRPDLVLVDMQLPDIDGHEVLRRLRADPTTEAIPCISLSANAMPEDIHRALQAGFADYWTKPLDFRQFMRSLDALFGPGPADGD